MGGSLLEALAPPKQRHDVVVVVVGTRFMSLVVWRDNHTN